MDLRPGTYSVTFTLTGFNTAIREGHPAGGELHSPINVEMRVGSVAESVTVKGESPVVDVQTSQRVRSSRRNCSRRFPQVARLC